MPPISYFSIPVAVVEPVGMVIGFIIALSGVTAEEAGDVSSVRPMVSTLISGMWLPLYHPGGGAARPLADHQLPNSVDGNGNTL